MNERSNIVFLSHAQLDKFKWDACISRSPNGLIYAYSYYLDAMADNWDALVLNDYEWVMPLPFRKKYGIYYIYQPFLVAQLGLFGPAATNELLQNFLSAIPKKFRYWDFPLNHQNLFIDSSFPLYQRVNYVLDLEIPYESIYKNYRENIRRNIKKSRQYGCSVSGNTPVAEVISLAKSYTKSYTEEDFVNFQKLYSSLESNGHAICYGVYSDAQQLLASAVFFYSHNRAYYILVGNHPNGRTLGASHALIDGFIQDHAGKKLLLDFEGSDIRNLAFFYSSFGAQEEHYAAIRFNRLPWWCKWLRK